MNTEIIMCDNHPDALSVKSVWLHPYPDDPELVHMCSMCLTEHGKAMEENKIDTCEWCGKQSDKFYPRRDLSEGMHGPVYKVCKSCESN